MKTINVYYDIKRDGNFDRVNSMKYVQGTPDIFCPGYSDTIWSQITQGIENQIEKYRFYFNRKSRVFDSLGYDKDRIRSKASSELLRELFPQ